jgi:hypothetical protein
LLAIKGTQIQIEANAPDIDFERSIARKNIPQVALSNKQP